MGKPIAYTTIIIKEALEDTDTIGQLKSGIKGVEDFVKKEVSNGTEVEVYTRISFE